LDRDKHFYIDKGYLAKYYGYNGNNALCISTKQHKNFINYIRDPALLIEDEDEELRPDAAEYNTKLDVVFDEASKLFFIVLYAWYSIAAGDELMCFLNLGTCWYSRDHKKLFLQSRINHWQHRNAAALEKTLLEREIKIKDIEINDKKSGPAISVEKEWRYLGDEGDREKAMEQQKRSEGLAKIELYKAFERAKCSYLKKSFIGNSVTAETKLSMKKHSEFIPEYIEIEGELVRVNQAALKKLTKEGHNDAEIEIREVVSISDPSRYFSSPWWPAFCVVAKQPIKKGSFVLTYAGQIEEEVQNPDSVYVYDLQAEAVKKVIPHYSLPNLLIDAQYYGGIARFVNDSRYRHSETINGEGSSMNISPTFLFYQGTVHIAFYAVRDIKQKEELISHYGDDFWRICTGQMLIDHREYYKYITQYNKKLIELCRKNNVPLPPKPDYLLERNHLFERKTIPYKKEILPNDYVPQPDDEWYTHARTAQLQLFANCLAAVEN
jgi:hypothetical protein